MFIAAYRVVKFALQNFWRNFWLSVITISMLVLTLLSINVVLVLNVVTDKAIAALEERIEVAVYFKAEVKEEKVADAAGYLRGLPQVRDVEVITADEALERFRQRHAADESILRSLDEIGKNPLGPALTVKAHAAADYPFILSALDNPQFRDDIREKDFSDVENIIERIRTTTDRIRWFGLGIAGVFLAIAILIVFNTVRIGIFIHREDIGIMKLVGATDRFVRAPFLLESIFYSLIAVVIVAAIIFPILAAFEPRFNLYFDGNATGLVQYFRDNWLLIFGGQFAVLALLNIASTGVAIRRYLRV